MSAPARLVAALQDRYRIDRELGAGGMATVYLAEDVRHHRKVALKVLRPELAAVLGAERFLQEIRTTAALQHPNILPLFDSGEADGSLFYVMPFVDGQTLRDRLDRERQLGVEEALRISTEVAEALQYAHEQGVIHRDIKPENVLLANGRPMVADFGIALAVQQAGGERMTQTGLSLGTPQYMSPEQAMGERTLDARADVYALGAVTYEMLTGDPPFTGSSVQAIVARLLTERPTPVETLRDTVPPAVAAAVMRALAKLPADRFASAAAFAQALRHEGPASASFTAPGATVAAPSARSRTSATLVAVAALSLTVAAWSLLRPGAPASAVVTYDAALPDSATMTPMVSYASLGFGANVRNLSIAPDGRFVVFVGGLAEETPSLWYRSLVDASLRRFAGTEGAASPRVSPDGTRIAYFANGRSMVVPVDGGTPRVLHEGVKQAVEWISPTRLYTLDEDGFRLTLIDADGGPVEEVSLERGANRCVFGLWMQGIDRLLCSFNEVATVVDPKGSPSTTVRMTDPDGEPGPPLAGAGFRLVDGRYLVYLTADGELRAAPYDSRRHLVGRSVALVPDVYRDVMGAAQFDVSANGSLVFAPSAGQATSRLVVRHGNGEPDALPVDAARFLRFDLSRDRRRLASVVGARDRQELRIHDLRTGQLATWVRAADVQFPAWSPRGDRMAVQVLSAGRRVILLGSPDVAAAPETLTIGDRTETAFDVMEFLDERTLLVRDPGTTLIATLDLSARPVRVDTVLPNGFYASVSPDGRRLAWQSPQSGGALYAGSFPPGASRTVVAQQGVEPLWLSDSELLFRTSNTWWLARLAPGTGELTGPPTRWAHDPLFLDTPGWSNRPSHDGGILYSVRTERSSVRYLRMMPDFVVRMKAAVDEANR